MLRLYNGNFGFPLRFIAFTFCTTFTSPSWRSEVHPADGTGELYPLGGQLASSLLLRLCAFGRERRGCDKCTWTSLGSPSGEPDYWLDMPSQITPSDPTNFTPTVVILLRNSTLGNAMKFHFRNRKVCKNRKSVFFYQNFLQLPKFFSSPQRQMHHFCGHFRPFSNILTAQ